MTRPETSPQRESDSLIPFADVMKRDWDQRARENARWYINTLRLDQSEEEFDRSGERDVAGLIGNDLPLLCDWRASTDLRLLEIGCGIGRMSRHLAPLFREVVSIDVSGEMIRLARARLAEVPNLHFHETSGVDLALFPDESFDVVFCAYVIQHVPSAEAIEANLREAFRVLRPRGVFKFITNGVHLSPTSPEEDPSLDTWSGAPFPEEQVRRVAISLGAQILGVIGDGTQYCWSLLRKRASHQVEPELIPRVRSVGRADDLRTPELAPRHDPFYLGIVLEGVDPELIDTHSTWVRLGDWTLHPCYAGRRGLFPEESVLAAATTDGWSCQLNVRIPSELAAGRYQGWVESKDGAKIGPFEVILPPVAPTPPHLLAIANQVDGGLDLHATGPKASWKIFADYLPLAQGTEDPAMESRLGEIEVDLSGVWVPAERVSYLAANGVWEIGVTVPEGEASRISGDGMLQIRVGGLVSNRLPISPLP
ncbi:MAG: class I SAM-dependent methyltransferase [Blastocatellia bacterium]